MKRNLPVGSIVLLKNGKKPIAVIGYKMSSPDNTYNISGQETLSNKIFDYCAVLYPEGLINSNTFILFDEENIDKVIFTGYESEDSEEFFKILNNK